MRRHTSADVVILEQRVTHHPETGWLRCSKSFLLDRFLALPRRSGSSMHNYDGMIMQDICSDQGHASNIDFQTKKRQYGSHTTLLCQYDSLY